MYVKWTSEMRTEMSHFVCYSYNYSSGGKTISVNVSYHFKTVHEFKKAYPKEKEAASKEVTV